MPKPKTAKEIVERFKKDLESVYGLRFDEQGRIDTYESAIDCPDIPLQRIINFVERKLTRLGDPEHPLKWRRDQPPEVSLMKRLRESHRLRNLKL